MHCARLPPPALTRGARNPRPVSSITHNFGWIAIGRECRPAAVAGGLWRGLHPPESTRAAPVPPCAVLPAPDDFCARGRAAVRGPAPASAVLMRTAYRSESRPRLPVTKTSSIDPVVDGAPHGRGGEAPRPVRLATDRRRAHGGQDDGPPRKDHCTWQRLAAVPHPADMQRLESRNEKWASAGWLHPALCLRGRGPYCETPRSRLAC